MVVLTLDSILGNLAWYSDEVQLIILIYSLKIYERQVLAGLTEEKQKQEENI